MKNRQIKAYQVVAEKDRLTKEKHRRHNEAIDDVVTRRPVFKSGMWVWCYDPQHTLRTSHDEGTRDKTAASRRIKAKLANLWTGPFKILAVGPNRYQDMAIGPNLLYLDLGRDLQTNPRVSVARCKRCHTPSNPDDVPGFLPWKLCSYVLHRFAHIAPPFYLTSDDVTLEMDITRAEPTHIIAHRISRGPGGTMTVHYETRWKGHAKSTWEADQSLQQYGDLVQHYWLSNHVRQVGADNRHHRDFQKLAAHRAVARLRGSLYVPPGYALLGDWRRGPALRSMGMRGAHIFLRTEQEGWQLGVIHQVSLEEGEDRPYTVNFVDLERRFNVSLSVTCYCTDINGPPGSWCFVVHVGSGSVRRHGT